MLVWVASYPRSGNHLAQSTLAELFGINRFGTFHTRRLWVNRLNRGYEVPEELRGLHRDELLEALRARPEPFFVKTHRREHAADPAPALYLVRDGRDVHVSQAHWRADKDPATSFAECLDELVSRPIWSRHVRDWRTRDAPTAVIRFEELLADSGGDDEARLRRSRGTATRSERRAAAVLGPGTTATQSSSARAWSGRGRRRCRGEPSNASGASTRTRCWRSATRAEPRGSEVLGRSARLAPEDREPDNRDHGEDDEGEEGVEPGPADLEPARVEGSMIHFCAWASTGAIGLKICASQRISLRKTPNGQITGEA